jgi:hypothetical protein
MSDLPQDLMPAIAQALAGLDIGQPFKLKATTGPILFVVVPGAAGDHALAKNLQRKITAIAEPVLRDLRDRTVGHDDFSLKVWSYDQHGDLLVEVEVFYPYPP